MPMLFNQPTLIHKVSFLHPLAEYEAISTSMISPINRNENDATTEWGDVTPLHKLDLLNGTESDEYSTAVTTDFEKLQLFAQSYQNDDSYYLNKSSRHIDAPFEDYISTSSLSSSSSTETLYLSGAIAKFDFVQPFVPHPRLKCRKSQQKPVNNVHYLSPLRAKLAANQLLRYESESDFHSFMTRFHYLPFATQFKFEMNMHINDYYAVVSERIREEELDRAHKKELEKIREEELKRVRMLAEIELRKNYLFTTMNHNKSRSTSLLTITEE